MSLHWTSLHCDSAEQYLALCGRVSTVAFAHQQPGGGDTPGVAVAPVALAGAIIPGVARFIVVLSAQAGVFGVGATVIVGSRLVATSCVISGVESGKAAPLVGGPPGVELHTVVNALPSGDSGDMVPVVLPTIGVGMVPNAVAGIIAVDDIDVVDGVIIAGLPGMAVETVPGTIDGVGTDVALTACGGAAVADDDTGIVEPGKSVINDVAGVADSMSGAVVVDAEEAGGTADIVGAADVGSIVPMVTLV